MKANFKQCARTTLFGLWGLMAGVGLSAPPLTALAAAGDLDPTFDSDGKVTTAIGSYADAYGVAIQSDGRIVVVAM